MSTTKSLSRRSKSSRRRKKSPYDDSPDSARRFLMRFGLVIGAVLVVALGIIAYQLMPSQNEPYSQQVSME